MRYGDQYSDSNVISEFSIYESTTSSTFLFRCLFTVDIRDKIESFFHELNEKLSKLDAVLFANSLYLGGDHNPLLAKAFSESHNESTATGSFDFKTHFSFMVDSTNDATERLN